MRARRFTRSLRSCPAMPPCWPPMWTSGSSSSASQTWLKRAGAADWPNDLHNRPASMTARPMISYRSPLHHNISYKCSGDPDPTQSGLCGVQDHSSLCDACQTSTTSCPLLPVTGCIATVQGGAAGGATAQGGGSADAAGQRAGAHAGAGQGRS